MSEAKADIQQIEHQLRRALEQFSDDWSDLGFIIRGDGSISAKVYSDEGEVLRTYALFVEIAPVV